MDNKKVKSLARICPLLASPVFLQIITTYRMKKLLPLLFLLLLYLSSCNPKKERIENELMECVYSSYQDGGVQLKRMITDFEKHLVEEGFLKDTSGKSYLEIFQKIANNENLTYTPKQSFVQEWQKVGKPPAQQVIACQLELLLSAQTTKEQEINALTDSLLQTKNVSASAMAKVFLSVLEEEDFELDYYKFRFLSVFNMLPAKTGIGLPTQPEIDPQALEGALAVYLNENSEVIIDEKTITIEELRERVRDFEMKNMSESVIWLNSSGKAKYSAYIAVQTAIVEAINSLRDELAQQKFGMDYQDLDRPQAEEIEEVYPMNFVEQ